MIFFNRVWHLIPHIAHVLSIVALIGVHAQTGQAAEAWVTNTVSAPGLEQRLFFSQIAGGNISYHLYIPEAYYRNKKQQFPVIYWLHGYASGVQGLSRLVGYFDWAMRSGKIPPALVVFPNGLTGSMWCDSKDGRIPMESVFIRELIPQIDRNFRTTRQRSGRLLEGFSMGGYGAARLGFKYPDLFGAVSMLGAGPMQKRFAANEGPRANAELRSETLRRVYGDDQSYFFRQSPWFIAERNADILRNNPLQLRILVGESDEMYPANLRFSNHLFGLGIQHNFAVIPEVGHNPLALLKSFGNANWSFYQAAFDHRPTYYSEFNSTWGYQSQ